MDESLKMGCSFGLLVGLEILGLNSVGQVESCHRLTEGQSPAGIAFDPELNRMETSACLL